MDAQVAMALRGWYGEGDKSYGDMWYIWIIYQDFMIFSVVYVLTYLLLFFYIIWYTSQNPNDHSVLIKKGLCFEERKPKSRG